MSVIGMVAIAAGILLVAGLVWRFKVAPARRARREAERNRQAAEAKQRAEQEAEQQYQDLRREIEALMPTLVDEDGRGVFDFAIRLVSYGYRGTPYYELKGKVDSLAVADEIKEGLKSLLEEATEFARDRKDFADARESLTERYTGYCEAMTMGERVTALEALQRKLDAHRAFTRSTLGGQWGFDTSSEAVAELLTTHVQDRLAELIAGADNEVGVLALFDFWQKWRETEDVHLPENWLVLVTKYVPTPELKHYPDAGGSKFSDGEWRHLVAEAIYDGTLAEVKLVRARVNEFEGYRQAVGDVLLAQLELRYQELYAAAYPEMHQRN